MDEGPKDTFDDRNLLRLARRQRNTLVLDALALSRVKDLDWVALFIKKKAVKSIWRHTPPNAKPEV